MSNSDVEDIRDIFESAMLRHPRKPIFLVIIGDKIKERWIGELEGLNLPIYSETSLAIKAIKAMHIYHTIKDYETLDSS